MTTRTGMNESQEPCEDALFFDFRVGTLDCVALSDGYIDAPLKTTAPEIAEDELKDFLTEHGDETERRRMPISCLFVKTAPGRGMLIDAGIGTLPGPNGLPIATAGRLGEAMAAAGIDATAIETVLISHIHPDHIGGLFCDEDRPAFPNAYYFAPAEEVAFWGHSSPDLGGTLMSPGMRADTISAAKRFLDLAGDRLVAFASGDEVVPGVQTIPLEGHTPGQVGFLFDGGEQSLLYTADAAAHRSIAVKRPDWRFSFDTDATVAIATRKRLIELLVEKGWAMFTPHFPWPSLGTIVRRDGETNWYPADRSA